MWSRRPRRTIVASLRESLSHSAAGPDSGVRQHARRGRRLAALGLSQHPGQSSQGRDGPCAAPSRAFRRGCRLVEQLGFRMIRRSLWSGEPLAASVFLVDSIGELAALYSLATVAFVGGSLVPRGGHNILEPALYGVPIVTGNHYENFRDVVNFFARRNAVRIVGVAELPLVLIELIENARRTSDSRPERAGRARIPAWRHRPNGQGSAPADGCSSMNPLTGLYGAATTLRNTSLRSRRAVVAAAGTARGQRRKPVGRRFGQDSVCHRARRSAESTRHSFRRALPRISAAKRAAFCQSSPTATPPTSATNLC